MLMKRKIRKHFEGENVPLKRSKFPRCHFPANGKNSSWDDKLWPIMQNVLLLSDDKLVFLGSIKSKVTSGFLQ